MNKNQMGPMNQQLTVIKSVEDESSASMNMQRKTYKDIDSEGEHNVNVNDTTGIPLLDTPIRTNDSISN